MIYKEKNEIYSKAIVLSTYSLKERNRIVNFFLEENSEYVSIIVYGFNSKKSNYKAILQPISLVDLHLIKKKNNEWSLVDVSLIDSFERIKKEYFKIDTILKIFKVIEKFPFKQSEIYSDTLYKLFYKLLYFIEDEKFGMNLRIVELYFYYYFIYSLGIKLNPTHICSKCKTSDINNLDINLINFGFETGNVICDSCKQGTMFNSQDIQKMYMKISKKSYKLLLEFDTHKFTDLTILKDLKIDDILYREVKSLFEFYLSFHLNKKIYL